MNYIQKAIREQMDIHKHSMLFLERELKLPKNTVQVFFNSPKGGFSNVASKLIEYYNLKIVKIS